MNPPSHRSSPSCVPGAASVGIPGRTVAGGWRAAGLRLALTLLVAVTTQAADEPPRLLFAGPRVGHYAFAWSGAGDITTLEFQLKNPGGDTQVLLSGTSAVDGTNRVLFPTSGTYQFIRHEVRSWPSISVPGLMITTHAYIVHATTNVDLLTPQAMVGSPCWDETFDSDRVTGVNVSLTDGRTLTLNNMTVLGDLRVGGTGAGELHGTLTVAGGTVHGDISTGVNAFQMEGTQVNGTAGGHANRVSFQRVKAKGMINPSGDERSVVLVEQCEAATLGVYGGMVRVERTRLTGTPGLSRAVGKTVSVEGCYFRADADCTATELLRLSGNDFYGDCGVDAPPGTLFVVNNVMAGTFRYNRGDLKGTETLAITGNSFLNREAAVLGPIEGGNLNLFRKYRLDGNYWGDPSGPSLGPNPGGNWLGPVRGACTALALDTTWLAAGSESVSGLADADLEPDLWVNDVRYGQNVFSSDYEFARAGRRTLLSFDLRTALGSRPVDDLFLQVGPEIVPPVSPGHVARRRYPAGDGARTLDFILPARPGAEIAFTLNQRRPDGTVVPFYRGGYRQRGAPARPLRIGLKLMTIQAWGYARKFSEVTRPDQDTSTVSQDRLTTAMAALLPLRKREDIRIEMLPSAEYSPLVTGLLPLRHNALYFGLARQLQTELDRENAARTLAGRQPLDFLLAVVPLGNLSANTGSTGFNHSWYPRIAVIEETEPEAAIHEFGHAFGLYRTEQYNLPTGWQEADGFEIYVDNSAGARVWGASLFVPDEGLSYRPVATGIRHCPVGVFSGLRDVMGAIAADGILPGTHRHYTEGLYGWLGEGAAGDAGPSASRLAGAVGGPASGTRRIVLEALVQPLEVEGRFYHQFVRGTTACRVAPPDQGLTTGGARLGLRLRAVDAAGRQVGQWECLRPDRAEPEIFKWSQTFDVPEAAVRYELESSYWATEFLAPIPGEWPPQLKVTSGAADDGTLGAYADLEFGLAGEPPLGRPLGLTLLVSSDEGGSWRYQGDFDGLTSARIWRDGLPVTGALRFKLVVSDGFRTWESVAGPYRRAPGAFAVDVTQPWAGAVATAGTAWTLAARISGLSELPAVQWTSSVDGFLGAGGILAGIRLGEGDHLLTCTATSADGSTQAATREVTVLPDNVTHVDWQVDGDALSLAVAGEDPVLGRVIRPRTGRSCEATVTLRSPGVAAAGLGRLYYQPPGEPELMLAERALSLAPLETASLAGTFVPTSRGIHRLRAEVWHVVPETLTETNRANNQWTWAFTNLPPVAPGVTLQTAAGEAVAFALPGFDPDGDPLEPEITGLPVHGHISGTLPDVIYTPDTNFAGTDSLTFRVSDGLQWSAPTTARITVRPAGPSVPRAMTVTGQEGQPLRYAIPASGTNLGFSAPMLPILFNGLSLDAKTGVLTGVPSYAHAEGVTVTVTNAAGRVQGQLKITILANAVAPEITSASEAFGAAGSAFAYQIQAGNGPQRYLASGLPPDLFLNEFTGVIGGTPLNSGVYQVGLAASNSFGLGAKTLTLTVASSGQPPSFARLLDTSAELGKPFVYDLARFCANDPVHWEIKELPPGLSLAPATGTISGTPLAAGFYSPTVTVRNGVGQTSVQFVFAVPTPPGLPVLVPPGALSGTVGRAFQYRIQASGGPTRYGATGLPANLVVDPQSGWISGQPTVSGRFRALLTASNAAGQGGAEVILEILPNPAAPLIGAAAFGAENLGAAFDFLPIVLNGAGGFTATGLPAGLTVDRATGRITGRFEKAGRYVVGLAATNAFGPGAAQVHLRVVPNLAGWLAVAGLTGESALPSADPDRDGEPNLVEYAFDSDATVPLSEPLLRLEPDANGHPVLVYRAWSGSVGNLFADYEAGGIRYEVETAAAVTGPWAKNVDAFDARFGLLEATDGTWQLALPLRSGAGERSRFVRLRVSQSSP